MSSLNGHANGNGHAIGVPIVGTTSRAEALADRLPPQNDEAEKSVLGSILHEPECLPDVMRIVKVEDFFLTSRQYVFQALIDLYDEERAIDAVTLADMLISQGRWEEAGGDQMLFEITEAVPTAANAVFYAQIVAAKAKHRRVIDGATRLIKDAYSNQFTPEQLVDRMGMESAALGVAEDDEIELPGAWPDPIREAAYQGVIGEIMRAVEPHTTADPAAILIQLLVYFSNVIGHGPHWYYESSRHALNLFCCVVGRSSRGGKGTSLDKVKQIMAPLDPDWYPARIMSGLATGEGLIEHVRDPRMEQVKVPGDERLGGGGYEWREVDPGVLDRRCLWEETEFDGTLAVAGREGNILSAKLRQLWDSGNAQSASRTKPVRCTGAHVSIIAHCTLRALLGQLSTVERSNGFGNRFLWVCARRSRNLPLGGQFRIGQIGPQIEQLRHALNFTRLSDWSLPMTMSREAEALWCREYGRLSRDRPGGLDDLTSRAEAQVRRLACIYAVLDCTAQVQADHLAAALAIWDYCEQSCACIFGGAAQENPDEAKLLKALGTHPEGLTTYEVRRRVYHGKIDKDKLARILGTLVSMGKICQAVIKTGGRDRTVWSLNRDSDQQGG